MSIIEMDIDNEVGMLIRAITETNECFRNKELGHYSLAVALNEVVKFMAKHDDSLADASLIQALNTGLRSLQIQHLVFNYGGPLSSVQQAALVNSITTEMSVWIENFEVCYVQILQHHAFKVLFTNTDGIAAILSVKSCGNQPQTNQPQTNQWEPKTLKLSIQRLPQGMSVIKWCDNADTQTQVLHY
jgi:hypothetical protein